MKISSTFIKNLAFRFEADGIPFWEFLNEEGIDKGILDEEIWFDGEVLVRVWGKAIDTSRDTFLGLRLGEHFEPASIGIAGFLAQNSKDLMTAFTKIGLYNKLIGDMVEFRVEQQDHYIVIEYYDVITDPEVARHIIESEMAATVVAMRYFTQKNISPVEATFKSSAPENCLNHDRLFSCALLFKQQKNTIRIPISYMLLPVTTGNSVLLQALSTVADSLLKETEGKVTLSENVRRIVIEKFKSGMPRDLETIANELSFSSRTLQRKLQQEGQTLGELVDQVTMNLAKKYLSERNLSISEISYVLGFNDPSNFSRSFKRLIGMTPENYRVNLRESANS